MTNIGIIPNPASGKDIRRLVAKAFVVSNLEKVNIVSRMLVGILSSGNSCVHIMPDSYGIGKQAIHLLRKQFPDIHDRVTLLDMALENAAIDSQHAVEIMAQQGVQCLIVLGGDGTTRIASKVSGDMPILPVSTGTNNALPYFVEGTIAGLCASYVAQMPIHQQPNICIRNQRIEVWVNGELADIALIDVAISEGSFSGSRAVWNASELRQIAVTRALPSNIGLSSIIGMIWPIEAEADFGGIAIMNDKSLRVHQKVSVPLGPGLMAQVCLNDFQKMALEQPYPVVAERPLVVALDGERELVLKDEDSAFLVLKPNGPYLVDVERAMKEAVASGYFVSE